MNHDTPVDELVKVVVHEFYGSYKIDSDHYANMYMSQKLCHISQLPEFLCTMQDLLYRCPDPDNVAYLRKYLSAMPGKIPDLVRERLEQLDVDLDDLSLAGLHEHITTTLQKECIHRKTSKSVKKQLGFDSSVCDIFVETYHFGCSPKKGRPDHCKSDCGCFKCKHRKTFRQTKGKFPKKFGSHSHNTFPHKAYFKRRPKPTQSSHTKCYICKNPGHWASQCPLQKKTKFQNKIMDLFTTGYDPAEWDLVSTRSEGEYLSLTSLNLRLLLNPVPPIPHILTTYQSV
jgi:hypothetical protein